MAKTQPWFRFYTETPSDGKMKRIAATTGLERALIVGVWAGILSLAKKSPMPGVLLISENSPVMDYEIADECGTSIETISKLMEAFIALDMLTLVDGVYICTHWNERQFTSDDNTQSWQKWRDKNNSNIGKKNNSNIGASTHSNTPEQSRDRTETDTEQSREESPAPSYSENSDAFDEMRITIQEITGLPIFGPDGIKAINDLLELGAIREDIQSGYNWIVSSGKSYRYPAQLVGPARTAMSKRLQKHPTNDPNEKLDITGLTVFYEGKPL